MVVFDENADDTGPASANHISVILAGAHLQPSPSDAAVWHATLLALLEDSFGLPRLGDAITQKVPPIFLPRPQRGP